MKCRGDAGARWSAVHRSPGDGSVSVRCSSATSSLERARDALSASSKEERDDFVFAGKVGPRLRHKLCCSSARGSTTSKSRRRRNPKHAGCRCGPMGCVPSRREGRLHRVDGTRKLRHLQAARSTSVARFVGRGLKPAPHTDKIVITHPDKVLFPAMGLRRRARL